MEQSTRNKKEVLRRILEALLSVLILILTLQLLNQISNITVSGSDDLENLNYSTNAFTAVTLFFAMALAALNHFISFRGKDRLDDFRNLVGVVLYLVGTVMLLIRWGDLFSSSFCAWAVGIQLLLGRIIAIIRDRRVRNIVTNVFAILLILAAVMTILRIWIAPIAIFIFTLAHIVSISFSQINFRTLRKIIQKTYAIEILFGMLLLIVSFSVILQDAEASIETYGDALWYCFAIVTTIGFGDFAANGLLGRVLSVILGMYGIIVVSLITSIIVNFYNEVKNDPTAPDAPQDVGAAEDAAPLPTPEETAKENKQ